MSGPPSWRVLHRRAMRGWPASFPVAQFPNAPLLVALGGAAAARVVDGRAHGYARAVFYGGLVVWAYEEVAHGVNWFRRLLGAAGLAYVVVRLAQAL